MNKIIDKIYEFCEKNILFYCINSELNVKIECDAYNRALRDIQKYLDELKKNIDKKGEEE